MNNSHFVWYFIRYEVVDASRNDCVLNVYGGKETA